MAVALMRDIFGLDTAKLLWEAKVPGRCINSGGGYAFFNAIAVEVNKKGFQPVVVVQTDRGGVGRHFAAAVEPACGLVKPDTGSIAKTIRFMAVLLRSRGGMALA
jgi:hypothetical protein